ncbi:polyprenyl synthetase family protein [Saccharothrix obliqua]|uniref:polyprenyl synthetase family protein n=1 Tax=Saccharothrix obliqua TaxID=2861747 RepID=UPI001C5D1E2D|nr:polyprenyl synthetase family protein [Saccharothrix obliqua]MBW4721399.1 polyprenyl synthetase family protein [Saccharothrix obliqua]
MTKTDVARVADPEIAALVRAEVERRWPDGVSGLAGLARYGLLPFGKMMGPWLVVRSALAVGGELAPVLPAAVAVECVQVGAMMHDDIIDSDPERRSKKAAYATFGEPSAIVGGDGLYFHGFAALAECRDTGIPLDHVTHALTIMSDAGLRIGDAAVQEIRMGRRICTTDEYLAMIRDKSGGLLWMACGVGGALAGATGAELAALRDYSDLLGTGYQIRDDLMAYDGTRSGKPNISDVRNGRPTLPVLLAHRYSSPARRQRIEDLLADTTTEPEARHVELAAVVRDSDALTAARDLARDYARRAEHALRDLPPSEHRDALADLTAPGRLV